MNTDDKPNTKQDTTYTTNGMMGKTYHADYPTAGIDTTVVVNIPKDNVELDEIRAIFVKHSVEKSEELELFDTDVIIDELSVWHSKEVAKAEVNGQLKTLDTIMARFAHALTDEQGEYIAKLYAAYTTKLKELEGKNE